MNNVSHSIACVEQFHLIFLDLLGRKLDKRHYALKGGCNLRFFLRSIRYSEDMDLDVSLIPVATLEDQVEQILKSRSLGQILQARGLKVSHYSAPEQTETTQRWKLTLESKTSDMPLHTKIEFSRRGLDNTVTFGPVDSLLMRNYQMTPFLASHYPPETAFHQKISALAQRSEPQARDIFDLDHLLRSGVSSRGMPLPSQSRTATDNALSLPFDVFKSQVLAFLHPDYRSQYDDPAVWDEMVLRVVTALEQSSKGLSQTNPNSPDTLQEQPLRDFPRRNAENPADSGPLAPGGAGETIPAKDISRENYPKGRWHVRLLDILTSLQRLDQPVLETGDIAVTAGVNKPHASKIAARLAESGHLVALRRGVWAFPGRVDPLAIPERLTAPQPAYISLQSALYHHGMISQMPSLLYAVTLARTRIFKTPLGAVSVHHITPDFFFGYQTIGEKGVRIATPEKALLDIFYLAPARSRLFCRLPEAEKSADFNTREARAIIARIPFTARRTVVARRFEQWLSSQP